MFLNSGVTIYNPKLYVKNDAWEPNPASPSIRDVMTNFEEGWFQL
jgi:hypothetical protein